MQILDDIKSLFLSPLAKRILAVNLVAPILLAAGFFYLDYYEKSLVSAELKTLRVYGSLISAALGKGAIQTAVMEEQKVNREKRTPGMGFIMTAAPSRTLEAGMTDDDQAGTFALRPASQIFRLVPVVARSIVLSLSSLREVRVRLFDHNGVLLADSNSSLRMIPNPSSTFGPLSFLFGDDGKKSSVPAVPLNEPETPTAFDYAEVGSALADGATSTGIQRRNNYEELLSVALPIEYYNQIVGALMITSDTENIKATMQAFRTAILRLFLLTLFVTIILSFYMGRTIIHPLLTLAKAALHIRLGGGRRQTLPDLSNQKNEIGILSTSLHTMTEALWERLDATERFAADVAHEIKNPLSSMRSAVETIGKIADEGKKEKLLTILRQDLQRLDRLITDISNLSRLDAELSREASENVTLYLLAGSLIESLSLSDKVLNNGLKLILKWPKNLQSVIIQGHESRFAQVFYNLLSNAFSFSPKGGTVTVSAESEGPLLRVFVDDNGPGIPQGQEEAIFRRFYCERPTEEKFGLHSGLGLSISMKIMESVGGSIRAENIRDEEGSIAGARFILTFPLTKNAK